MGVHHGEGLVGQAILTGTWKRPELLISTGPRCPFRGAVRRDDGLWETTWRDPDGRCREAGLRIVRDPEFTPRPGTNGKGRLSQYVHPLGVRVGEEIRVYPRLGGIASVEKITGPLPVDEERRSILTRDQALRGAQGVELSVGARDFLADVPIPAWFGLSLYGYQKDGAHALVSGRPYTADEPGLGKTRQLLAAAAIINAQRVIIVCPPVAITSWAREASASGIGQSDHPSDSIVLTDASSAPVAEHVRPIYSGRKMPKIPRDGGVVIVSDSMLSSRPALAKALAQWESDCLIVDEAHRLKNAKAVRTKAVLSLSTSIRGPIFAASGTPIYANPLELTSQLELVRRMRMPFGGPSSFLSTYFTKLSYGAYVPRSGAREAMREKLEKKVWIRRRKSDVLADLPDKIRVPMIVDVDLKNFRQAHTDVITRIDEWFHASGRALASMDSDERERAFADFSHDSLSLISTLRVAAGLCKIPTAIDIITEHLAAHPANDNGLYEEPVILWAHHKEVADALLCAAREAVGSDKVAAIVGSTSPATRGRITADFQNGKIAVLVASITAAGVAITLTRSHTAFFVETDWTPANVIQAEDRIHRIGQTIPPTLTTLIAPGTLDETIQLILHTKSITLNAVLGGDLDTSVTQDYAQPAAHILNNIVTNRWNTTWHKSFSPKKTSPKK